MDKIPRVHLFLGPEEGQKSEAVELLKNQWNSHFPGGLEDHKLRSSDTTVSQLVSLLRNGSLFFPALFVTYTEIESLKKDDLILLRDYVSKPNPDCLLLLLSPEIKVDTELQKLFGKTAYKVFWELFENQRKGWVLSYFRNKGCSIDDEAAEFFLEMVGNTTDLLKSEADRLLHFHPEGIPMTMALLEEYLQHSREETPFTLFNAMASGKLESSLEIVHALYLAGESNFSGVMVMLSRQWKTFYQFKLDQDNSLPPETSWDTLKVFSKKAQNTMKNSARLFQTAEVESIYRLTQSYDLDIRLARTEEKRLLMELYIYKAVERKGRNETPLKTLPLL